MSGLLPMMAACAAQVQTENINLSGSPTSPIKFTDFAIDPQTASVTWQFRNDGTVWVLRAEATDFQYQDSVQWSTAQDSPIGDFWIRFTDNLSDPLRDGPPNFATLGTWQGLASTRAFGHSDSGGFFSYDFSCKVEIATDSGGSNIVATGYYGGRVEGEI